MHLTLPSPLSAAFGLLAVLGASTARADTLFVDPVGGDDGSGNGSQALPWKTLTHAMGQLPAGPNSVFLLPGEFSEASGEVFPITVPVVDDLELIGQGVGVTVVRSNGAGGALAVNGFGTPVPTDAHSVDLRGITFDRVGVSVTGSIWGVEATVEDAEFLDTPGNAISASGGFGFALVTADRCRFERCLTGASAFAAGGGSATIYLRDCLVLDGSVGVNADGLATLGGGGAGAGIVLLRSRIQGCTVGAQAFGNLEAGGVGVGDISLRDSILSGNQIAFYGSDIANLQLDRSTVAGNLTAVQAVGSNPADVWVLSRSSILWGNGFDVDPINVVSIQYSNFPAGVFGVGVTHVDPLFVDAANGDFHLQVGSPLIDAGNPSEAPADLFEGDLDPRLIDGDGDGTARVDMGFDEWNPGHLDLAGTAQIATVATFTTSAPAASAYALLASLGTAQVPFGPSGAVLIDLGSSFVLSAGTVTGVDAIAIPNDPVLIGLELFAQAYTNNGFDETLTNRVDLTLAP
ncbi:DUF1565 domain-containing protein [Engelhardtia mirabilis]|uniref:DUF1565 domain-containing protein n=1 Tax=Engelhardtia mirabilis TaxID=2528011 RepID=A0A518BSE2_9BACT|nr:hypothetical protein Pla133_50150 [Planctomycetes bacterium Pla133]QDV04218.1 hypothetical protein Pla86_50130 [Planctomycetes bacterium Pla86]